MLCRGAGILDGGECGCNWETRAFVPDWIGQILGLGPLRSRFVPGHRRLGLAETQRMTYVHRRAMLTLNHQANWHGKTSLVPLKLGLSAALDAARERSETKARKTPGNRKFSFLKIEAPGRALKEHTPHRFVHDGVLLRPLDFRGLARRAAAQDVTQSGRSSGCECAIRRCGSW
jgi:hypothetical protein